MARDQQHYPEDILKPDRHTEVAVIRTKFDNILQFANPQVQVGK